MHIETLEELSAFNKDIVEKYEKGQITSLEYQNARLYVINWIDPENGLKLVNEKLLALGL